MNKKVIQIFEKNKFSTFEDLENLISELPTTKEQGDSVWALSGVIQGFAEGANSISASARSCLIYASTFFARVSAQ